MAYVECFKLQGLMHTTIMFLQCELWNQEWKEKAMDKVILSQKAMSELLSPDNGTKMLANELGLQNPKQIFIPIVHEKHWFLFVISSNKTIYILDSFPSQSREPVISGILSTLKKLLEKSTAGSHYTSRVLEVKPQENKYASFTKIFFAASASSLSWLIFFSYDCGAASGSSLS